MSVLLRGRRPVWQHSLPEPAWGMCIPGFSSWSPIIESLFYWKLEGNINLSTRASAFASSVQARPGFGTRVEICECYYSHGILSYSTYYSDYPMTTA